MRQAVGGTAAIRHLWGLRFVNPYTERFWSKVNKTANCWVWTCRIDHKGYGRFAIDGVYHRAHRVAWELTNGTIYDGLHVCHECDNPRCVRPDHLFLGTRSDNMQDALKKGRFITGEDHAHSKLTAEQVKMIRASTERTSVLARRFQVSYMAAKFARARITWKQI
jgi:hypothetical protein